MKRKFTGKTRLFLCISGAIIAIALIMQIAGVGLNLGIDFTGGSILNYSVGEDYDINDEGCYRIRHLEDELYREYIPNKYKTDDVISYQWHQNRDTNLQGQFNFYYNITKNSISGGSMTVYMILLMLLAVMGEILGDFAKTLLGLQ